MIKILIADDDKNLRKFLMKELSAEGYTLAEVDSGTKVMELLEKEEYDILLLDLNMPGLGGMNVLKKMKDLDLSIEVIVLTGYATVQTAVEAMRLGCYDYLTKPFTMEQLMAVMEKAYEKKKLLHENLLLKSQIKRQSEGPRFINNSPLMVEILENVKKMALSEYPILILGETGVGKELIAKLIHNDSPRKDGPFIPINCGAIPENMLESELFGHEKGAFTGSYARKPGLLEIADHGTIFLDEVGELPLPLQGKLLRVIESKRFFRVGGTKEIEVDVRFVSATNKNLKEEIKDGRFRQDLYYRLTALTVYIPPLRERKECIPLFIDDIIKNNASFRNKSFSDEAMQVLMEYPWPGNVRELLNVLHRTLLLCRSEIIEPYDLSLDLLSKKKVFGRSLEDVEKDHILTVLKEAKGVKSKAAEILGIDSKTLYRKLLSYGVKEP